MNYIGIATQQRRNNERSLLLLCMFPVLVVALIYLFCYLLSYAAGNAYGGGSYYDPNYVSPSVAESAGAMFVSVAPWVIGAVLLWFIIAYFANTSIINSATSAVPLSRKENKRVYDIVENLCMSQGMKMPSINIIDDESLNAYASGINQRNYAITFSKGIIAKLNDQELEAVAAHELSHIRNHDVRLMIISIVFVGIFSLLAQVALRSIYYSSILGGGSSRRSSKEGGGSAGVIIIILIAIVVAVIGYFFSILMRFAISRKREYLADAGSAEMTHNPLALASALRKISGDPRIEACTRSDVAQLFIEHPGPQAGNMLTRLFDTHPPIEKRIQVLEQF